MATPRLAISSSKDLQLGEKAGKVGGRWAMEEMFRMFPQLKERADRDPDLVMIDEPTEGLSPMMVEQIGRLPINVRQIVSICCSPPERSPPALPHGEPGENVSGFGDVAEPNSRRLMRP